MNKTQIKRKMESAYTKKDPWGFKTNKEDKKRKDIIIKALKDLKIKFKTAIDIGCGEGWITQDLPADIIYGYDISETAINRLHKNIKRVDRLGNEKYDLVVMSGVLYEQWDAKETIRIAKKVAKKILLTCNIKSREINNIPKKYQVYECEFPYRKYTERLAIYDLSGAQHRGKDK